MNIGKSYFDNMLDYVLDLRGQWEWKRNTTEKNNREMKHLDDVIEQGLRLRDRLQSVATEQIIEIDEHGKVHGDVSGLVRFPKDIGYE